MTRGCAAHTLLHHAWVARVLHHHPCTTTITFRTLHDHDPTTTTTTHDLSRFPRTGTAWQALARVATTRTAAPAVQRRRSPRSTSCPPLYHSRTRSRSQMGRAFRRPRSGACSARAPSRGVCGTARPLATDLKCYSRSIAVVARTHWRASASFVSPQDLSPPRGQSRFPALALWRKAGEAAGRGRHSLHNTDLCYCR